MDFDERLFYCSVGLPFILSAMNRIYEGYDPNGYTGQQPQEEKKPSMLGKVAKYGALGAGLLGAAGLGTAIASPETFNNIVHWGGDKIGGGVGEAINSFGDKVSELGSNIKTGAVNGYQDMTSPQVNVGTEKNPEYVAQSKLMRDQTTDSINNAIKQSQSNLNTAIQHMNQQQVVGGNTPGDPMEPKGTPGPQRGDPMQTDANAGPQRNDPMERQGTADPTRNDPMESKGNVTSNRSDPMERQGTTARNDPMEQRGNTGLTSGNSEEELAQQRTQHQANSLANSQRLEDQRLAATQSRVTDTSMRNSEQLEANRQANAMAQQQTAAQDRSLNSSNQVELSRQANAQAQQNAFSQQQNSLNNTAQVENNRQANAMAQQNNFATNRSLDNSNQLEAQRQATTQAQMNNNAPSAPTRGDPMQANANAGPTRNDPMQQSPGPVRNDPMQASAQSGKSGSSLQTLGVRAASRWGNQAVNSAVGKMDHAVGAAKGALSGTGRTVV